jgi:hypothetical protein
MKTAKKKPENSRVETRYYKTTNVNGAMQFQFLEYATAKLTPMHERIRDFYPAETRIGKVVDSTKCFPMFVGCFPMFIIEKHIASKDWKWAHEQAVKQYRAKRLQTAKI